MVKVPKKRTILILLLIVAIATVYISLPSVPLEGLVIAQPTDADILNPALTLFDPATRVTGLIYESLMTFDENMNLVPSLAEYWYVEPDNQTITFFLKENVRFHSGYPFTAEAVKYTIERLKRGDSKHYDSVKSIESVRIIDNYTVSITLEKQDRYLLEWFATVSSVIVDPHASKEYGEDFGVTYTSGTGPFKLREWIPDDRIVLDRNEDYTWGPPTYQNSGPAKIDVITFKVIPSDLSREARFEAGEVAWLAVVATRRELLDRYEADPHINLVMQPKGGGSMVYVGFNCAGAENTHSNTAPSSHTVPKKVRQAISYAVDKEEIIDKLLAGVGRPAYEPLASTIWGYDESLENMYAYNPGKAENLLAEAGYADGLNLSILTTAAPPYPDLAVLLSEQLSEVGINLSIEVLVFEQLIDKIVNKNFDMFIMGYTWPFADMVFWLWHSTRWPPGPNRFWWGDENTDAIIDNTWLTNTEVALAALHESQRIIMEDAVFLPVYERMEIMAYWDWVENYQPHPLGMMNWKLLDTSYTKP